MNCSFCRRPINNGDLICKSCGTTIPNAVVRSDAYSPKKSVDDYITQIIPPTKKKYFTIGLIIILFIAGGITGYLAFKNYEPITPPPIIEDDE